MRCLINDYYNHLFTGRKQSLGQGNVSTRVCRYFCPGGGGLPTGEGLCLQEGVGQTNPPEPE